MTVLLIWLAVIGAGVAAWAYARAVDRGLDSVEEFTARRAALRRATQDRGSASVHTALTAFVIAVVILAAVWLAVNL